MELRVLGPLELVGPDGPVAIGAAKLRRLLAVLAVAQGSVRSGDALIDAIWAGKPPASQDKLLQVYISQLRKLLPRPAEVVTVGGGYLLRLSAEDRDDVRFERLLEDGRAARDAGNPKLAVALLERALRLWRSEAYAEFAADEFARDESRRLEELRLVCREECLQARLDLGQAQELLPALAASAAEQPLRERVHGQLMLALYRSGRQAEALDTYSSLRGRLDEELGLEPGPELRDLQRRILQHDPALAQEAPAEPGQQLSHVPSPLTTLIGRGQELLELHALLERREVRLVTLSGAAGSGKTRLALAYAEKYGVTHANGCVFVELASIRDPSLALPTIARELGMDADEPNSLPATLAMWLAEREMLLIVDNVEHLAEIGPSFASLVAAGPRPTLLLTSRRVLHVSGEHVFPVAPLPEDDALELFVQRAAAASPRFALTSQNEEPVREICRRLDGLPLAIELAAARVDALTPEAIRERLDERLSLLTGGPRDLPARQQTMREALDWSGTLLDEHARITLARLSTFVGGCTLNAAAAVCEADIDTLSTLVGDNLVQRIDLDTHPRFGLLEIVHEYAHNLLAASGEEKRTRRRHAEHFADLVVTGADSEGTAQAAWLAQLDPELPNIRAAIEWCEKSDDDDTAVRLAVHMYRYWYVRGHLHEGAERISRCLDRGIRDDALRTRALANLAGLLWTLGRVDEAERQAQAAVASGEEAGLAYDVLRCSTVLGLISLEREDFELARTHFERSGAIAREIGRDLDAIIANTNLANLALEAGDLDEAEARWRKTVEFHQGREDDGEVFALSGLGFVALQRNRLDDADHYFQAALQLAERLGFQLQRGANLVGLAAVHAERNDAEQAASHLGQVAAITEKLAAAPELFNEKLIARAEQAARTSLGDEQYSTIFRQARQRELARRE